MVRNITRGHWVHIVLFEENLGCIRLKVSAEKISNKVLLRADVGDNGVELEGDHQVEVLSQEGCHQGV